MIKPMLAEKLDKAQFNDAWTHWCIEEKFDGHRVILHVLPDSVKAYTRPRKRAGSTEKTMAERPLPDRLMKCLVLLPVGIYDGELIAGDTATDVTRTDLKEDRRFVMFDIIALNGTSTITMSYDDRRKLMGEVMKRHPKHADRVELAESFVVTEQRDITRFVQRVWKHGGEGAIVKRRASVYQVGQRSKDWIKIKKVEHAALEVIGWEPSRGDIQNRGPFAIVRLRDSDGNLTTCKTLNNEELDAFEVKWKALLKKNPKPSTLRGPFGEHPDMGRKLVIEFFGRTRDGGYKGPVTWDRWEDE